MKMIILINISFMMNVLREILDQKGYNKSTLQNIKKDDAKEIFKEIFAKYKSLDGIDISKASLIWKDAAEEVINENTPQKQRRSQLGKQQLYHQTSPSDTFQEIKKNEEELYEKIDYDDLIQAEFPTEFNENVHEKRIMQLAKKLADERAEELYFRKEYENKEKEVREKYKDDKDEKKKKSDLDESQKKKIIENELKKAKFKMKVNIKNNKMMKNDEFLLLLCLMRKKKEKLIENNPYIVDYAVSLNSVYQSETPMDFNIKCTEGLFEDEHID